MNVSLARSSEYASWNGPICPTCNRGYIGEHRCDPEALRSKIAWLQRKIDEIEAS